MAVQAQFQNGEVEAMQMNGVIEEDIELDEAVDSSQQVVAGVRKVKRVHRSSSGSESSNSNHAIDKNLSGPTAVRKNSRKSRDGRGRGLPKKGGAGGKGTWGAPGDELFEDGHCRDEKDPNYDSESEDEYVVDVIKPQIGLEELSKILEPVLLEYYDTGITEEVARTINELDVNAEKSQILEIAISKALDHKAAHREMTSVLISDLYGKVLSSKDVMNGFDAILDSLAELTIDTPEAPSVIGQFIARAIADDCMAPKYVSAYKGKVDDEHKQAALDKAELLLSRKHGIVRLDNIWGTGGGIRPVKYLVKQMVLLLKEYLSSGDIAEATRCLQELEVPHFHHELVYEATVMVLEDSTERAAHRMCDFLKSLNDSVIITPEQMSQGFRRVYDALPDIVLDVPSAYTLLERFAGMCHRDAVITTALLRELPQRGRKRFVSEGDGGKIKETV
ncbi:programmed cell death protein 4-like [Crassostrea virginica]|uniref:Programmed cell death protein 4 n=1 Tax=Crassostrea virginica TaxID=6565 RepID=A0A8B8ENN0_CRAVI|nr:programmed cell death protein 4-like [Crassostrea virginica]